MKNYIVHDEWNIIEEGFQPAYNEVSEVYFLLEMEEWDKEQILKKTIAVNHYQDHIWLEFIILINPRWLVEKWLS
ncbi:hypothetical protein L950_0218090 [Sphingobacterium sp. IITKGP-BTPF85]|nr:hypothetical protein L950_0218090 [Sphingobacterium sp. IITKGP-BTPF85]